MAFNIACAFAPTISVLIGMRLVGTCIAESEWAASSLLSPIAGFWGSAGFACGGAVVSDLFIERDRAMAMSVFTLGPVLGPALGPIIGGFMTETVGFKWIFVLLAVLCGFAAIVGIGLFRETYGPVIKQKVMQDLDIGEKRDLQPRPGPSTWKYIWVHIYRPFILLTRSFVCFILGLYLAL